MKYCGVVVLLVFGFIAAACAQCPIKNIQALSSNGEIVTNGYAFITDVQNAYTLSNNNWGIIGYNATFYQSVFTCTGGAFGYNWTRTSSTAKDSITYPEAIFGASPFGGDWTSKQLPRTLDSISKVQIKMNIEHKVTDGGGKNAWDFAYDIWLTSEQPGGNDVSKSITDEIMVWFDWSASTWTPTPLQSNAVQSMGVSYAYQWYTMMNNEWRYHQFRIEGGNRIPSGIDLKPFLDYVQKRYNASGKLWLASIEIGTETYDGTAGQAMFNTYEISIA